MGVGMNFMVNLFISYNIRGLFLVENDPDVIQNSILSNPDYSAHLLHTISKQSLPIKFDEVESAKLLLCKNNLTEREYRRVKKCSRKRNVFICPYKKVTAYITSKLTVDPPTVIE